MSQKVVAIVGSYRKGGTIDSAVQAILSAAREKGAETHTLYLATSIWSSAPTAADAPRPPDCNAASACSRTTCNPS